MSTANTPSSVRQLDVLTVGHALVDVLSPIDDFLLETEGLVKGSMNLIDDARAASLYNHMSPGNEQSGGSAANTAAGVVACGGTAGFVGVVGDDELGIIFSHDLRAVGVKYDVPAYTGAQTGTSLILISPDGQRTMNTNIAVSNQVAMSDLKADLLESAAITYVEGYLFDDSHPFEGWTQAINTLHAAGNRFSISLADSFCVERNYELFLDLLNGSVDICFGNEDEIKMLFDATDLEVALTEIEKRVPIAAITLGAKGSILIADGKRTEIEAEPANVVDTTGAGDLYAAGVLTGIARGDSIEACGALGSRAAATVISRMGARVSSID